MQPQHAAPNMHYDSFAEFYRTSAYAAFPQEHRAGGSFGISIFEARQDPIDFIDAAVPELVFTRTDKELGEVLIDVGEGPTLSEAPARSMTYFPTMTEARTRVTVPHAVTVVTIPEAQVTALFHPYAVRLSALDQLASRMIVKPIASSLMDAMWQVSARTDAGANLYLDGLVLQFLSVLIDREELSPLGCDLLEDRRIARAIDYIHAHLGDALTVAELAGVAALSPSQFARVFKSTTGEAVWSYVQRCRIERAREALQATRLPISQIAFDYGFSSQNHMTTLFRRYLGVTPGALRAGR